MELPKIISVDDHVVEPPHVWQTYLPAKHREQGPRVERATWAPFVHRPGARYDNTMDPDGQAGDYWVFEDEIIYVHKRFVAIPLEATPDGDLAKFDRTVMQMTPVTYDEMRPGCYDRDARVADMAANWVDGSLPFPTFPRFCGQTFKEAKDLDLGLACVRAYNDWMIEEWCEPSGGVNIPLCIIPLWDAQLARAEVERRANPGLLAFKERLLRFVDAGDWEAAVFAQNVVLESMEDTVFRFHASVADPKTQQVLEGVVADERRHLGFGENDLGRRLARHPEDRERLTAVRAELDPLVLRSFEEAYEALGLGRDDRPSLGRDYLHSVERLGLTA